MDQDRPTTPPDADPRPAEAVAPAAADAKPPEPKKISIDRFSQVELRVAKILSVERVENADKLLKMQIDVGEESPRQLVAGIALAYEPEQLVGKRIVVVANLKPARIRGVESQGMLLAADLDGKPFVATFDVDVPPGTRVR